MKLTSNQWEDHPTHVWKVGRWIYPLQRRRVANTNDQYEYRHNVSTEGEGRWVEVHPGAFEIEPRPTTTKDAK